MYHPAVRLWSSHESVRRGEPTVLALLETLAAMSVSVWIGIHFGTWMHVAVGAAIAPFLLLRTDESCRRGLRWAARLGLGERSARVDWVVGGLWALVGLLALGWAWEVAWAWAVVGLWVLVWAWAVVRAWPEALTGAGVYGPLIRFATTLAEIRHGPLRMIRAIPRNWWRAAVATDCVESPEFVPAPMDASSNGAERYRPYEVYVLFSKIFKHPVGCVRVLVVVGLLPHILIAFAYRLSLKSTALVWFPLLWALWPVKPADREWRQQLEIGAELGKTRFVGAVSTLCFLLLAAKYVLWTGRHELVLKAEAWEDLLRSWSPALADSALAEALVGYVRPGAFPLWQVATLLNSILGLFVWWKLRTWLAHFRHNAAPSDESITRTFAVAFFFRRLLTSYVIVCNGFMALQLACRLPVPEIGWKMFPWV